MKSKKLKYLLFAYIAVGVAVLSGCALRPVVPYDTVEKGLLGGVVVTQALDYTSTKDAFGRGCVEGNRFLGEYPSDSTLILAKIIVSGVVYFSANNIKNHIARKVLLTIVNGIGLIAYEHNINIDCGGK